MTQPIAPTTVQKPYVPLWWHTHQQTRRGK
jgi:hypothetical protein